MKILETWEKYKKSGRAVPEFDAALASFSAALGITKDQAVEIVARLASEDPSIVHASDGLPFPLIRLANAATQLVTEMLGLLDILEKTDDLEIIQAARSQIAGVVTGGDSASKKALLEAIQIHKSDFPKSTFAQKLDPSLRISLNDLLRKGVAAASEFKYVKGLWKSEGHLPNIIKKLLDQAADGDPDAIDDLAEMSKTRKGKEYLASLDKSTLADKITQASRHSNKIDTKYIMKAHEAVGRSLAAATARAADPNRLWNIVSDIFGRHTSVMDRLRAMGRAAKFVPGILKFLVAPALLLGAVGYGGYKAYEGVKGLLGDEAGEAGATPSPPSGAGGSVADRVRGELQKIYSK